jgi:hypothetical protein
MWSIMTVMANLGMILVPPGYTDKILFTGGGPYGASATTGERGPTEADLPPPRTRGRGSTVASWIHAVLRAARCTLFTHLMWSTTR